jgi:hypothetical protein
MELKSIQTFSESTPDIDNTSNAFAPAISSGFAENYDAIILTIIVLGSAIAVYFIIHYFFV